ncbi:cupin domain-containing protein [Flavihumibacter petaseus]|uniref:Cupin type-2 domain-containing protein n=1 Tax=Flavihumibacter petaseus NBRC 106054 TaxID=1220578 RepID=A0A0E9N3H9_9BACT|nr:cupin domain-containing protein [Flavihumibacter petaseus]GAO44532.1 hypothetical protein FPE01S_03_05700 [Flavihumibacter petaseus NBRC 106054]
METILVDGVQVEENAVPTVPSRKWMNLLWLLVYPVGVYKTWKRRQPLLKPLWLKLLYTIVGLPIFLLGFAYCSIVLFAAFLPPLDRTVGQRADRTITNSEGGYSATFVKTGTETNGAYELVQVELEPLGGNDWHYHNSFEETFTVVEGRIRIGEEGKEILLNKGDSTTALREHFHFFKNADNQKALLQVKVSPASGLEKTLRVAYGLINDGELHNDMTKNPWHMVLLLAYSESYLPMAPSWFQEPLISALAKIAQWKGEDKVLYKYFKASGQTF